MDANDLAKALENEGRILPRTDFFEVIDGEEWHVFQDSRQPPRVNLQRREVFLPQGTTRSVRSIVRHELLHVLKSPTKTKGGMYRYLRNAIEDALVNVYSQVHLKRPIQFSNELSEMFYKASGDLDRAGRVQYDIAAIGSFDYEMNPIVTRTHLPYPDQVWLDEFQAKLYDLVEKGFDKEDQALRDRLLPQRTGWTV